jgi:hypothetical protein
VILVKYCLVFIYLIIDIKIITKGMTNNCGQCTSGGKFQVRVATSGLIVKFSLMNNVFSNLTTLLQVVLSLQTAVERNNKRIIYCIRIKEYKYCI